MENSKKRPTATLALADGTVFSGYSIGSEGETSGEVVFNTSMTGYQEILTDPSYAYQMITFTYPHIGNVGVNLEDVESRKIFATGIIVKQLSEHYSNYRACQSLEGYLKDNGIVGIGGIDTRRLVVHLRETGAQIGVIASGDNDAEALISKARSLPSMEGRDLVKDVTIDEPYSWNQGVWTHRTGSSEFGYPTRCESDLLDAPLIVVIDCGVKYNILRLLVDQGFRVQVVPAFSTAAEILHYHPDGIFLSNGPGDPAVVDYVIETVKELLGKKPLFGICLGHQILGLALNAPTYKLKFGHRGANHPVRQEWSGKVEITAQNHGFATDIKRMPDCLKLSHLNINDNTVSGFDVPELKAFSVQYHPEASPGPNDSQYLFARFSEMVKRDMSVC